MTSFPYRGSRDGLLLSLRVTPKSSSDQIAGIHTAAAGAMSLAVKVRAVPDKGLANKAVIRLLAETFGLAASSLTVVAGKTDRNKTVLIGGDFAKAQQAVDRLIAGMKT